MLDRDQFEERAAIAEFDGGLSRFQAETMAAQEQGLSRWQAIKEIQDADSKRNPAPAPDHSSADVGQPAMPVPGVQPAQAQEGGPMPVGDVPAGRNPMALLALRTQGRGILR